MAVAYFTGTAVAVAQIDTVTITADNDDGTTYTLTIGTETVSTPDTGNTTTTATNLTAAWNASTHCYFEAVTATSAVAVITLTADTAGCPFVAASSVAGGTGTIGAVTASTANAGPNDWSTAANWGGTAAVPVDADDVVLADSSVNICWGLAQSEVELDSMRIDQSYTGKLGLDHTTFATSADGETTDSSAVEYRDDYLAIEVTNTAGYLDIGQKYGGGTPAGSQRLKIDLHEQAAYVVIHNTHSQSSETGRPCVRLKANNAATTIYVASAPGGVGLATEKPDETSTIAKIVVSDSSTASKVYTGIGSTITHWVQYGGNSILRSSSTMTTVIVYGGILETAGDFDITSFTIYAGTARLSHDEITGGTPVVTANLYGGTTDATGSAVARTWTHVYLHMAGAVLITDGSYLTISNLNEPGYPTTLVVS